MKRMIVFLFLAAIIPLSAKEQPSVSPTPEPIPKVEEKVLITFPKLTTAPNPAPVVNADGIATLLPGQVYVIQSSVQFFVESFPPGKVTPTYDDGPLKFKGVFVDGNGETETRTLPGPFIATLEVTKGSTGQVWIVAIPVTGIKVQSDIQKMLIEIGVAPQPPPVVVVPPKPTDPPVPIPPVVTPPVVVAPTGFRVIMVQHTMSNQTKEQLNTLYSTTITKYLNEKCVKSSTGLPEWRRWDSSINVDAKESPTISALWNSSKALLKTTSPQLIIATDGKAEVFDLPPTEAETLTLLKKYGG